MSNLICPFCGGDMIAGGICHYNLDCPIHDQNVPTEVLELLESTKKKFADLSDKIGKLETELEKTRKALDVAVNALKLFDSGQYTPQPDSYGLKTDASRLARKTLKEITALEQKDTK